MDKLDRLIEILLAEQREPVAPQLLTWDKEDLFRALCNVRLPLPISSEFLALQDEYLQQKRQVRGIIDVDQLPFVEQIALWQGDITRLQSDAIVNAGNEALLGCFSPLHNCIDNVIHSYGGVQLRLECHRLMQGRPAANGSVLVTGAYNLPSRFVFHTVGPRIDKQVRAVDATDLASCYRNCLDQAAAMRLQTLAFSCLSTGVFRYPKEQACHIAVATVQLWLAEHENSLRIIFNTFLAEDQWLYEQELGRRS